MRVKKYIVRLTAEEREWLKALVSKGRTTDSQNGTDSQTEEAVWELARTRRETFGSDSLKEDSTLLGSQASR